MLLQIEKCWRDYFDAYFSQTKPESYVSNKKSICDYTDKKKHLFHYRRLKFFVRHGMIVVKFHEIISFKQNKGMEEIISFKTQKRKKARNKNKKDFFKLGNNGFFGKMLENVRNRIKMEFIKNCQKDQNYQLKLTVNGIHKSYTIYSS